MSFFSELSLKKVIAAALFLAFGLYIATVVPTVSIAWVSGILLLTIYLFAFEIVDVDVAAISIMVLLGLSSILAPIMGLDQGLVSTDALFNGFASNAVMSIIAVMIIGAGLDKTGIMTKVAAFILRVGGSTESRIIPIISSTVGVISSFMQNVGAAALFLIAAFVEAFWSSIVSIDVVIKYTVGIAFWVVLIAYFTVAGRRYGP